MYHIERTSYGLKITLEAPLSEQQVDEGSEELREMLQDLPTPYGLLIDSRALGRPDEHVRLEFVKALHQLGRGGLRRIAIVPAPSYIHRARRTLYQSGLDEVGRIIDTRQDPQWEAAAKTWLSHEDPPDGSHK